MRLVSVIQEFKELEAWHVRFRDKRRHAQVRAFKHGVQNIFQSLKTLRVCACTNSHSFQLWEEKFECRLKVDTIRASSGLQTRCPEYFSKLENTARLRMHKFTQFSIMRRKFEFRLKVDAIRANSAVKTRCPDFFLMVESHARLRMHKFTQISARRRKLECKCLYFKLYISLYAQILCS